MNERQATIDRLRAFPAQDAHVGQTNQDALGISRRDRETVAEALARVEQDDAADRYEQFWLKAAESADGRAAKVSS